MVTMRRSRNAPMSPTTAELLTESIWRQRLTIAYLRGREDELLERPLDSTSIEMAVMEARTCEGTGAPERCGHLLRRGRYSTDGVYVRDLLTKCVLPPAHDGDHIDALGSRWEA